MVQHSCSNRCIKIRGANSIKLVNLVAAPEGIAEVQKYHPDVDIYVAAIDEKLNSSWIYSTWIRGMQEIDYRNKTDTFREKETLVIKKNL